MTRFNNLYLLVALASASLLTACGGGTGNDEPAPASPQAIQSFNDLSSYCGADLTLPVTDTSQSLEQLPGHSVTIAKVSYFVNMLYAANGWSPIDDSLASLDVPMSDMRNVTPGSNVSFGSMSATLKMGVGVSPRMPAAAITCVKGLNGFSTATWRSRDLGAVDVSTLPAAAVDGFEWVANFEPAPGLVFFTTDKTKADPATARICHRAGGAVTWSCDVPTLGGDATHWTFSLASMSRGIYVLVAGVPTAP